MKTGQRFSHQSELAILQEALSPKFKHWMRDARKRSVEDTWRDLGRLIDTIEPQECRNYIRNAVYGPT